MHSVACGVNFDKHVDMWDLKMRSLYFATTLSAAILGLVTATNAYSNTPWGLIAKRAVGKVEQIVQEPTNGQPRVQVATVILEAPAQKIYETVISTIKKNQNAKIAAQNDAGRSVQVTDGTHQATLTVKSMAEDVSQLVVVATDTNPQDKTTGRVVQTVLRICQEMKKQCSSD